MKVKTKERLNLNIETLIFGGEGLGRYQRMVVFVPYTSPGDKIVAEVEQVRKNYLRARMVELAGSTSCRVQPPCPWFARCGGCQWQHLTYDFQLQEKTRLVKEAILYLGKLKEVEILPIIGSPRVFSYRNKVQMVCRDKDGEPVLGFFAADSHEVMPVEHCLLQSEPANVVLEETRKLFSYYGATGYDESSGQGFLRHLVFRESIRTGQSVLIMVTGPGKYGFFKEIVQRLKEKFPGLSLVQNINKKEGNVILGEKFEVLAGTGKIREKIGGLEFEVSAGSFFQNNTEQAETVLEKVKEIVEQDSREITGGIEVLLDVYCGVGMLTLGLSPYARKVYGIESNPPAVSDALANARLNQVSNCEFRPGEAEKVLARMVKQKLSPQVVVLNPPRKGCGEEVVNLVAKLKPLRIIYVSCEPTTLARDLGYLAKKGYKTLSVQPVDMFPQTSHIESIVKVIRDERRTA